MDRYLIDYLTSGHCWLLVGSGPSTAMGYPSWKDLAERALNLVVREGPSGAAGSIRRTLEKGDYPTVFQSVELQIGRERLMEELRRGLRPGSGESRLYSELARWPVAVYLTTNYDDEIQRHLAALGEAYLQRSNSETHMEQLVGDTAGIIVKLHGDLSTETGLVLTTDQYRAVRTGPDWLYWRNKMQSIFQMQRVVVIGHSLRDPSITHVIEAARQGSGVVQPVCWVAPDPSPRQAREYLEKYRIRVIGYDNSDGQHRNLAGLVRQIGQFVPSRAAVRVRSQIARVSASPLGSSAAATAFLVFNKLSSGTQYEERREDVILAAVASALPQFQGKTFTIQDALATAGWPKGAPLSADLSARVAARAIKDGLVVAQGRSFKLPASPAANPEIQQFSLLRERFVQSVELRLRRDFPRLTADAVSRVAVALEAALTGYFREGGLTLATTLLGERAPKSALPASMLEFISEASAQFDSLLERQAFMSASIEVFVAGDSAERSYLGRVSQGFLAFHCLGAFGELAAERWRSARRTVWLLDSNVQIPLLARGASTSGAFVDAVSKVKDAGVRLFTTQRLFQETYDHLRFAERLVRAYGVDSPTLISAAKGDAPRYRSNQFLEGFIRWRSAGNPGDWERYMYEAFGHRSPSRADVQGRLAGLGVEVVDLSAWPGFRDEDFARRDTLTESIKRETERLRRDSAATPSDYDEESLDAKARPEAEALIVIAGERDGVYHILSLPTERSAAWFISSTSLLNVVAARDIGQATRLTWQPEAFLGFVSTLVPMVPDSSAEGAFERLLWTFARSGVTLLDEGTVQAVFGGIIDQATLAIAEQRELYEATLANKYGESPEEVLARVRPSDRPLAALQLEKEMGQTRERQLTLIAKAARIDKTRADEAERELDKVAKYRRKMLKREQRVARQKRAKNSKRGRGAR